MHPRKIGLHFRGITKPRKGNEFTSTPTPVVREVRVEDSPERVGTKLRNTHDGSISQKQSQVWQKKV